MWFLNNREIIKDLAINTGTSDTPVYTTMCCTSEVEVTTDFEVKDFYTFCNALQHSVVTGAAVGLNTTVKLDINNAAVQEIISKIHTLLASGEVAQFNNQKIQYKLITGESSGVLTYTTYTVDATLIFSDLGGAAEDEGEFGLEIKFNGVSTASV